MLQESFNQLLNQFSVPIQLNSETNSRKAIITSQSVSDSMPNFDDKNIQTNWEINRGDIIIYYNVEYLIITDVQAKRSYGYMATMRPMSNTLQYTYMTEGEYYYDRLGNKVYTEEPKEVTLDLPCIAYQEGTPTLDGGQIVVPDNRITVIMPDNESSQKLQMNTEHQLLNHNYNIVDINLLQSGLRIFTMEWVQSSS
ncbi:hypothetical protein [Lentibacillus amyloliquefaciens]|uniref:Uncharacterized protein n=1 Tax=Lentibacillus amyloliquefaciens TaxID=1472767 RepID=A0A0U4E3L6_9BACI|nr:hypothetical protein [Lentibacillus amyloliquefaciens]ALX47868.1 hypothetical protein AOX59_04170 [Lentibacillus amyloliquefaciens]